MFKINDHFYHKFFIWGKNYDQKWDQMSWYLRSGFSLLYVCVCVINNCTLTCNVQFECKVNANFVSIYNFIENSSFLCIYICRVQK